MKSALIYYSHSDYSDVWPMMFGQAEKYIPENVKKYFFIDDKLKIERSNWKIINYDDRKRYQERVSYCLRQVNEELVLFNHEDMILYDKPDLKGIDEIENCLINNIADIVKLIKAEIVPNSSIRIQDSNLYLNDKKCYFSIQPSICKKSKILEIYENTPGRDIWTFEEISSEYSKLNNIKSMHYFSGTERKIGQFHWESKVFPYLATAIVKGKWNTLEYKNELISLFEQYNIDQKIRGNNEALYI